MVIGPLCQVTIPDIGVMHGRIQDGRGGGPRQPEAGDDQGGEEERERHAWLRPGLLITDLIQR